MERPSWAPNEIELDRPSPARVYDYFLGGSHNFAVDRAMARQVIELLPEVPMIARSNRAFLRRAVRFLVAEGVRQFLDIGSGIPTVGNVHEIAQQVEPAARVVYVDIDPVAVAHSQTILANTDRAAVVQADLRDPEHVLAEPELRRLLDTDQPIAILVVSMLHFIPDSDDPAGVIRRYAKSLAPGSYLTISHAGWEEQSPLKASAEGILGLYAKSGTPLSPRPIDEVSALFEGFDLVEPGVVPLPVWRPEPLDDGVTERFHALPFYAGVGRKS